MKRTRSIFSIKLVFLLVIFSFITTGQGLVYSANAAPPVLARVEVAGMLDDLQLPVYAHLQDATGKDYALVIASQAQLDQANVQYRILDKNAQGAEYFILSMLSKKKQVPTDKSMNVLLDDGEQVIIRSSFQKARDLGDLGVEVKWLGHTPMVLDVTPRPEAYTLAIDYDPVIDGLIGQVTQSKVDTLVRNLSGENSVVIGGSSYTITTRHTASGTPVEKATQYVYEFMDGLGLTVSYHNWSDSGYTGRNVVGEITGTTLPTEIVLITAHLDDMPSGGLAPGADDNGSGSVGVMVSAEMLSQQVFNRTVRFIVFTGEEQWLLGAQAYSDMAYQAGDNIVAVYNMDMISYDSTGGPDLRLHTRITSNPGYPDDLAIANTFIDVVNTYSLSGNLNPILDPDGITQSDHSAFWNNGYPAILAIEEHDSDMTPYYHTTSDTVSTLNMTYFTNYVKASVGTAAHLAIRDDGTLIADFTGSPTSGGIPLTVTFTDQSIGATSWSWDFGDTGTSTERNPVYTYNNTGTYTVSLTVYNASGSDTMVKTDYITALPPQPPTAEFTASSTNILVGDSVTFTDQTINNPTSWDWTFAGGTPGSSTDQNPVITYNTEGTFTVSLTATNPQGSDTETKVNYITVTMPPYCSSQGNTYSMEWIAGVEVGTMNNTSGAAGYTDFTSITCDLTGGSNVNVTLTPGFSGSSYTEYWKIWIDYNGDHDFGDTGEEVFSGSGSSTVTGSFTVASGIDKVTRMRVSMKYASYPTPCETFSYGEVEDYTANVTSGGGQAPVAEFTASATTITEGDTVDFTDLSTNNPDTWDWTFNGGTPATSTLQNPSITYYTAGTYTVALTATNAYGSDTETKVDYITVQPAGQPPVADFTASATTIYEGEDVTFTDQSTNNPDTWDWTFAGGTPGSSTQQNPVITYNTAGTYTVTLIASNAYGSDTETKVDYITVLVSPCPGTVTNPGFETGDFTGWTTIGDVSITSDSHTGSYGVIANGTNSSVEQVVIDLCANTTYTVSCWGKAKGPAGFSLGVKNYGGTEQTVLFTDSKNFVKQSITFTTGASNTSATIFVIKTGNKFDGTADDFEIVQN
jgi:PKD repeat protein